MSAWNFDSIAWWADGVHQATCRWLGMPALHQDGILSESSECLSCDSLASYYSDALTILRSGELDTEAAANLLFRARALKKWKIADPALAAQRSDEAIAGFIRRNDDAAHSDRIPCALRMEMRRLLRYWLPEPARLGWSWTGRFGHGNVAEHWSFAKRLIRLHDWCSCGNSWPEIPLTGCDCDHIVSRLSAVPKERSKDRLITVEPAYNSFGQQYAREALLASIAAGPLRGTAMDAFNVDGAVEQQRLALKASRTGKWATVDLSDASDCIAWSHVQDVFPAWVVGLLEAVRTPEFAYELSDGTKGQLPLHIYAGMGNATTFTVETLFFSALVVAMCIYHKLPSFCSTVGDDIICGSEVAGLLADRKFSFFRVGLSKSFFRGDALRESCGIFAYKGEDISAPRVDGYLRNYVGFLSICDLHRRLRRWPFAYGQRLSYLIAEECRRSGSVKNYSYEIDGTWAIHDDRVEYDELPPTRWNAAYQRREFHVPTLAPVTVRYSTDWRVARKRNSPPPEVWLTATLSEQVTQGDNRAYPKGKRGRCPPTFVTFPAGKNQMKVVGSWLPVARQHGA